MFRACVSHDLARVQAWVSEGDRVIRQTEHTRIGYGEEAGYGRFADPCGCEAD